MANEVKIKITSEVDTKGFDSANKSLAETKVAAYVAGGEIDRLNETMTESDRIGSTFGEKLKQSTTRNKIKGKDVLDLTPDPSMFAKFGQTLTSGLTPVASLAGNHVGLTIGAAAGAAAGPVLLSAIGAALAGGIGLGVLGLGVIKAVQADDKLTEAGKQVVEKLNRAITANVSTLSAPIMSMFDHVGDVADRFGKKLGPVFASLASELGPFTDKVLGAAEAIGDVLLRKATDSGPALDALGDGIGMLGDAASQFLDMVVDTGPTAADNLRLIFGAIGDMIKQTGAFLALVEKLSENEWLTGPLLPLLRKHYKDAGEASEDLADDTSNLTVQMDNAGKAAKGQQDALSALSKEMKSQADPVFALYNATDKLEVAQTKYNDALKKHGPNSEEARSALRKLGAAGIDLEAAVGALGNGFDGHLTPAMKNTLSAAGLTKKEISDLDKQFGQAKTAGDKFAKKYQASAAVNGISSAQGKVRSITDDLRDFQGRWTATMIVNYKTFGKPGSGGGLATGGISGAANGQTSGNLTWVGENGPELADLPSGTRVWSAGDSARMAAAGTGAGTGGTFVLRAAPNASRDLMSVIIEGLRYEVDRNGGGSVQRLLGSANVS